MPAAVGAGERASSIEAQITASLSKIPDVAQARSAGGPRVIGEVEEQAEAAGASRKPAGSEKVGAGKGKGKGAAPASGKGRGKAGSGKPAHAARTSESEKVGEDDAQDKRKGKKRPSGPTYRQMQDEVAQEQKRRSDEFDKAAQRAIAETEGETVETEEEPDEDADERDEDATGEEGEETTTEESDEDETEEDEAEEKDKRPSLLKAKRILKLDLGMTDADVEALGEERAIELASRRQKARAAIAAIQEENAALKKGSGSTSTTASSTTDSGTATPATPAPVLFDTKKAVTKYRETYGEGSEAAGLEDALGQMAAWSEGRTKALVGDALAAAAKEIIAPIREALGRLEIAEVRRRLARNSPALEHDDDLWARVLKRAGKMRIDAGDDIYDVFSEAAAGIVGARVRSTAQQAAARHARSHAQPSDGGRIQTRRTRNAGDKFAAVFDRLDAGDEEGARAEAASG